MWMDSWFGQDCCDQEPNHLPHGGLLAVLHDQSRLGAAEAHDVVDSPRPALQLVPEADGAVADFEDHVVSGVVGSLAGPAAEGAPLPIRSAPVVGVCAVDETSRLAAPSTLSLGLRLGTDGGGSSEWIALELCGHGVIPALWPDQIPPRRMGPDPVTGPPGV